MSGANVLIVDSGCHGLSLAARAAECGNSVRWYNAPNADIKPNAGSGFGGVRRVENWVSHTAWADVIICTSGAGPIERLEFFRRQGYPVISPSISAMELDGVREPVDSDDCAELSIHGFLGKSRFIGPHVEYFQYNRLMPKDYGPEVGEMGSVACLMDARCDALDALADKLLGLGHSGPVSVGIAALNDGRATIISVKCSPQWPILTILVGGHDGDPIQWMMKAREDEDCFKAKDKIGCAVGIRASGSGGRQDVIDGITRGNVRHLHPMAVESVGARKSDADHNGASWVGAGEQIAFVTGFGESVAEATKRAYGTIGRLDVGAMILRDDIGESVGPAVLKLKSAGYAKHFIC